MSKTFDVFLEEAATRINEARLRHLASLNLDIAKKNVLEVGAGVGRLTKFFEDLDCSVLTTDGRPESVTEICRQYPHRQAQVLDLEVTHNLSHLGSFDIVFCYGTLYHLQNPEQAIASMAYVCNEMFLLETCVTPGSDLQVNLASEDLNNPNQAISGTGCRPTRPWVMETLKKHFEFVYVTKYQPYHPDFDLDWKNPVDKKLHRAVFIGSRKPIINHKLSDVLLEYQSYEPESQEILINIGSSPRHDIVEYIESNPYVRGYSFRINANKSAESSGDLIRYVDFPLAPLNQNKSALKEFQHTDGTERLENYQTVVASSIHLKSFLDQTSVRKVDFLRIDTRCVNFFAVIESAGDRLKDILKIGLEISDLSDQSSSEESSIEVEAINLLNQKGFVLVDEQKQNSSQNKSLTFIPKELLPDALDLLPRIQGNTSDLIQQWAEVLARYYPLKPYPGWRFNIEWNSVNPHTKSRQEIWSYFKDKNLEGLIQFDWYFGLKFNLYLGNDLSSQLFIAGCYEPNELYFLSQVITSGMTVLDVGANDGYYSVFASKLVASKGLVFAFEPSKREYERLQNNIALNNIDNIQSFQIALSDFGGTAQLRIAASEHAGQNTLGNFIYEGVSSDSTEHVAVETLDGFINRNDIQRVDVIKVDIEGAEFAFLQGSKETLERFHPVLMLELVDEALIAQGSSASELLKFLRDLGYEIFDFGSCSGLPIRVESNSFQNSNIVAVHPSNRPEVLSEQEQVRNLQVELELNQQEVDKLQVAQSQLQAAQSQLQESQSQLQNLLREKEHLLKQTENSLNITHQHLEETRLGLKQAHETLEVLQSRLAAMESSKFWKIRTAWLNLKRRFNLHGDE